MDDMLYGNVTDHRSLNLPELPSQYRHESLYSSVHMKQRQKINFIHLPSRLSPLARQQIIAVSPCCKVAHIKNEERRKKGNKLLSKGK